MPIFPADDINPGEDEWRFFRIERMPDGDVEIEAPNYRATHLDRNLGVIPGEKLDIIYEARVRSFIGGGFYPVINQALHGLLRAFEREDVWKDCRFLPLGTIQNIPDDILVGSDYDRKMGRRVPFVLSQAQLAQHRETNKAFAVVFKAMYTEAEQGLKVWSSFPDDFPLKHTAMQELKTLLPQSRAKRPNQLRRKRKTLIPDLLTKPPQL